MRGQISSVRLPNACGKLEASLSEARPIAFSDSPRFQRSHNSVCGTLRYAYAPYALGTVGREGFQNFGVLLESNRARVYAEASIVRCRVERWLRGGGLKTNTVPTKANPMTNAVQKLARCAVYRVR
jgi:hypothetical protein